MIDSKFVIFTRVSVHNNEGEIVRYKNIPMATFHYVPRSECSKLIKIFASQNSHIDIRELMGEYSTNEYINPIDPRD